MPLALEEVRAESITEFTGLLVPRVYDCGNFGDPGGGALAGHPYFSAVPSRWWQCRQLFALVTSGLKRFLPAYPVIDEEYAETVAVYETALSASGTYAMAELGARWGTWGFRALAAVRRYNPAVRKANVYFVEPNADACKAIADVAALNGFTPGSTPLSATLTVDCSYASPATFLAWANSFEGPIDLVDVDIQGGEKDFFTPEVIAVLNKRTKRLIIGTHGMGLGEQMVAKFPLWKVVEVVPLGVLSDTAVRCRETLRDGDKWASQTKLQSPECIATTFLDASVGPVYQWDGEVILDNNEK